MWIVLAVCSSLCLGLYDICKKISVKDNDVLMVLFLNTLFNAVLMSPTIIYQIINSGAVLDGTIMAHAQVALKSIIVLTSWILGYFSIKNLPLTTVAPINATRPMMVLLGAIVIYGERPNALQWVGLILGFASLLFGSMAGRKEGITLKKNKWLLMAVGAMLTGAMSGLYDVYLVRRYNPIEVQAWFALYQLLIMGATLLIIKHYSSAPQEFKWRWSIPFISIFLTIADMAYFRSVAQPEAMIAIVSMIRRGSVIVAFAFGAMALKEKNLKYKVVELAVLFAGLACLVLGSVMK